MIDFIDDMNAVCANFGLMRKPAAQPIYGRAIFSPCGLYRTMLIRTWDDSLPMLPLVMLNASTADASINDPTITRCIGFGRRDGFGGLLVGNLYGLKSTDPRGLKLVSDPFGEDNDKALSDIAAYAVAHNVSVLCAWGVHGTYRNADARFLNIARHYGARLVCLGKTKGGHPKHPLYIRANQPFEAFN